MPTGDWIDEVQDGNGPALALRLPSRAPLLFEPYFLAGGRQEGSWRLTWMPLSPLVAMASAKNL